MIEARYNWQDQSAKVDQQVVQTLQDELAISKTMAVLLAERGIADVMDKSRTFKHTAGVALHLGSDVLSAVSHKVLEDHMSQ